MKQNYLYRGGMLCLCLGFMAFIAHTYFAPKGDDDWHFVVFMLLLAAVGLFSNVSPPKLD